MTEASATKTLNNSDIRVKFPILNQEVNGHPLVYFDNAASSQKPESVLAAMDAYYRTIHSNVHRGVHHLSQLATDKFEHSRERIRKFFNARSHREIIFTRGTTEGINLVATILSRSVLKSGDRILISEMEHHSNIVPWQMAAEYTGALLDVVRVDDTGTLDLDDLRQKLALNPKVVSMGHVSNALGTVNPIKEIVAMAREVGAITVVDGAQASPHLAIDVQDIHCDFYAISSHKMYGPTGIGALFGKEELLRNLPPYQGGGEMIESVSFEKTTYNDLPYKFEAGTPDMAGAIGLAAAMDFMTETGVDRIAHIEHQLLEYGNEALRSIPGIRFIGTAKEKAAVISFVVDGTHPSDIGAIVDQMGVAVRTGHHCTQPLMAKLGIPGTVRASFAAYNTFEEIDRLQNAVAKAVKMLK